MRLNETGEAGLLKILHRYCPAEVIGDDAAWFTAPISHNLVITTDALVEGVHFSSSPLSPMGEKTMPAVDVGWRAVAVNYSDLAAMGAKPLGITVALGLPPQMPVEWVEQMYEGMAEILQTYGGVIWGGDVVRSDMPFISITAVGCIDQLIIKRSTAQVGDSIVITGYHGLSRAGLAILTDAQYDEITELVSAHRRPRPRLDVLPFLQELGIERIAGMDSSDGLADALWQICRASGVGAVLTPAIDLHPLLTRLFPQQAQAWCWYGGEDFELVLTLPPDAAQKLVQKLGHPAQIIGEIVAGEQVFLGERLLRPTGGFQHFATDSHGT
ncbi:MAG: thiamine-phosphate kinase [Gloeomargarita sp. DG02_3_bins_56]